MASGTLPQELADHIIDLLSAIPTPTSDRNDLVNCTLVSKAWLPRTSRRLLKHIEVLALKFPAFLRFAQSSERFRAYTEELVVLGTTDMSPHWTIMLSALPQLCSLELWSNLLPGNKFKPLPDSALARHHHLAKLKIHCAELDAVPILLLPFDRVDTLELRSLIHYADDPSDWHSTTGGAAQVPNAIPLKVGRLILENCCKHNALSLLRTILRPTAVFANGFDREEAASLSAFLQHAGQDVEHINLLPTQDDDASGGDARNWNSRGLVDLAVLAVCPKLTSITLDLVDVFWAQDLCREVLRHMPKGISRLRIILTDDRWEDILGLIATHLRLSQDKYSELNSLELRGVCEEAESEEEVQALLLEMREEVETSLPPRYSAITKVLP
ncbi:uncharacterized protein PHACADRAFT_257389 [Phanerochaete carnosa HHB-10118-sp]|uniref:F-box domain-containing protein n=1 Tax=Phanerochaete carnosa (strain HHB-10118-sp) TaxID=650164 RepID=K5UV81_PHACS|nr:uncharacterized protein PHACADRAFT_257389 [Phanerochaete carnosa HHB-10118-sp]EKM53901.1 hypothetical protein PHACADRAFT_257389 [Phanerochaete carnosa HHB-10118-sp]